MKLFLLSLTIVVILAVHCEGTSDDLLAKILKKILSEDDDKADEKRALTNIVVTPTSISGFPQEWGACPKLDCTYVVSCGSGGSKEVKYGEKAECNNLKPGKSYTITICVKGEKPRKCSRTAWTCTTPPKGTRNSLLDKPCTSKLMSANELARRNTLNQLEELLAELE